MNTHLRLGFSLWMVVAGSFGSPTPCGASMAIMPYDKVEVKTATVRLGDVFSGIPKDVNAEIALAPAPCKEMIYDVNVLNRLASKYSLNWRPQSMTDHVTVHAACTRITADMVSDNLIRKIRETGAKGNIEVTFDTRAFEITLPYGQPADFTFNNFSYDPSVKRFKADVVATGRDGIFATPVSGRITVRQDIPVLSHRLEGGTVISGSDIDIISVPEEHINTATVMNVDQIVGRELRRDTDGGVILHTSDVMPPRLVMRGLPVILKIETDTMMLALQGKAMQDGGMGDVVRVLNTQSNRIIEGIVVADGVVRLGAPQKLAALQ